MTNPAALTLEEPLALDDARKASRALSRQRREAEDALEKFVEAAADAEFAYRRRLAQEIVRAEGTAAEREAVARSNAAEAARNRDISAGMVKVQTERLRGLEGERSQLRSLMDWSMRLGIDGRENHGRAGA